MLWGASHPLAVFSCARTHLHPGPPLPPLPHFRLERSTADPEHQILTPYPGQLQGRNATPVGPVRLGRAGGPFLHLGVYPQSPM